MQSNEHKANALINESSPYLLQHAYNPVSWYPWGEEALEKAKKEDKMLIISIGYAACHWCHVMERESFEDEQVAKLMNDNFICIKVDKEERPDVDDIYMSASNLINKRGGWPLNAFATAEGKPFWAGTYFPKEQWLDILNQFITIKAEEPERLVESANKIVQGIASLDQHDLITQEVDKLSIETSTMTSIASDFKDNMDFKNGGRIGSPKFPMPSNLQYLLQYHALTGDESALEVVTTSLDKMAKGGIYDQLGGGFSRYSTDLYWLVPHFEKMLYDNGQMLSIYADAFKLTKNPLYKKVVEETIGYLEDEMSNGVGGYFSSFDADSDGEEGKYYVWTEEEIDNQIEDQVQSSIFKDYFGVRPNGNWEGQNILSVNENFSSEKYDLDLQQVEEIIKSSIVKLIEVRNKRVKPGLDDKTVCAHNAMTITGLVKSYQAFGDQKYLDKAIACQQFIEEWMKNGNGLYRIYKKKSSSINGFMIEYSTYIQALINLYEVTLEKKYILLAENYAREATDKFFDVDASMFFSTSTDDPPLVARKKNISDNVIPSSNSMMARNLIALGTLLYNDEYKNLGKKMGLQMIDGIVENKRPDFYGSWCSLLLEIAYEPYEVVIVGDHALEKAKSLQNKYRPNVYYAGGQAGQILPQHQIKMLEEETMIYVCQNRTCKFPTSDLMQAEKLLERE